MANETMYKALMASESVQSLVGSTKFQADEQFAAIHDGALVTLGTLAPNEAYNVGKKKDALDDNVFLSKAPTADTDDVVIVDIADVSKGDIVGNTYKMGVKLYGLAGEAGEPVRYRVPMKHDKFWLSNDCFDGAVAVGKLAVPMAGTKHHVEEAAQLETLAAKCKYIVKIIDKREFTVGAQSVGTLYLCQVL